MSPRSLTTLALTDIWHCMRGPFAGAASGGKHRFLVSALTNLGCARHENQDRVHVLRFHGRAGGALACFVADGMGGAASGARAAELAIEVAAKRLRNSGTAFPLSTLAGAIADANKAILRESRAAPDCAGMGTTLSIAWFCNGLLYCAHVGDSRIYRIRDHRLEQLSQDHSLIADMLRAGLIKEKDARNHPDQNLISRAVGTNSAMTPDVWCEMDAPRISDRYLLCSDGLHGLLGQDQILGAQAGRSPDAACRHLVELARGAGGFDNISVVIAALEAQVGGTAGNRRPTDNRLTAQGKAQ